VYSDGCLSALPLCLRLGGAIGGASVSLLFTWFTITKKMNLRNKNLWRIIFFIYGIYMLKMISECSLMSGCFCIDQELWFRRDQTTLN
jgi:hypothetical protein